MRTASKRHGDREMGIITAVWEKWIEFKHEWFRITMAALISPTLYLIAFGVGVGQNHLVDGHPYIQFLVPGIIALTTMNTSFSSVGMPLNVQRLFEKSFDQIIISPTPLWQYILGQAAGGALRGTYAGCLMLILSFCFQAGVQVTPWFFLIMILNGMTFAALGVTAAILAKSHADIGRFSTFVILPMTFLCNTFFSLDGIPEGLRTLISILPLSQTSRALRAIGYGEGCPWISVWILIGYFAVFLLLAFWKIDRKKNL